MKVKYAEVDASGNLRLLGKEGILKKFNCTNTSLSKYGNSSNLITSLTDSSVMDRIYSFPKLKDKLLDMVIKQKVFRDVEIIANVEDVSWIYSKFTVSSGYKVLVSLVKKELLRQLAHFKALTTTTQVIANFLTDRVKGNFILVHSFENEFIVTAFYNGVIDYSRMFKSETPIDSAVELALGYYREQKKTEIGRLYYSGAPETFKTSKFKMKPLTELVKLPINGKEIECFIPFALSNSRVPYFYSTPTFTFKQFAVAASTFFVLVSGMSYFEINRLNKTLNHLQTEREKLSFRVNKLQSQLSDIKRELKTQDSFQLRPDIKYFLSLKKTKLPMFLDSFYKISDESNTYLLSISTSKIGGFDLYTITFCKDISSPTEFHKFISLIKENPFIGSVKIIDTKKFPKRKALASKLSVKFKKGYYEKN